MALNEDYWWNSSPKISSNSNTGINSYNGANSSVINNTGSNDNGLGALNMNLFKTSTSNDNSGIIGAGSYEDQLKSAQLEGLQTGNELNKLNIANATPSTMTLDQAEGLGGVYDWATANRGGGSSYAKTGLGVLSAATDLWSAYNDNKYKDKMAKLADRQQSVYEDQLAKQEAKQAKAQAAYDAAQNA